MGAGDGTQADSERALSERLRALPSVHEVLNRPAVQALSERHGRGVVRSAVRTAVQRKREEVMAGAVGGLSDDDVAQEVAVTGAVSLRTVINATGVVLHTNLGRAPLAAEALQAAADIASGYCNLEYDVEEGRRGSRSVHCAQVLRQLTGAQDALVVNNCAAAVLLALSALCKDRSAIISRGELVEIGGGFRIPEVVAQGGARLVEVGSTNRTRLSDYAQALQAGGVGAVLKVHRSNFAMQGFTASVDVQELHPLCAANGVPLLMDLGSGLMSRVAALGEHQHGEGLVGTFLRAGADLCMFSGDKLLGGPQAGILVGSAALVAACREHPLYRALRVDKVTLAMLDATLRLHLSGRGGDIPTLAMMETQAPQLHRRAETLCRALQPAAQHAGMELSACALESTPGGGSLPLCELPSAGLRLRAPWLGADALLRCLRAAEPAVVARVAEGAVLLDLRTVLPVQDEELQRVLLGVVQTVMSHPPPETTPC